MESLRRMQKNKVCLSFITQAFFEYLEIILEHVVLY